ncbi:conserved virulence factor C family protein [soil metagenome]
MKLNLDEAASARPLTLMLGETASDAPAIFQALLTIEGIQSVFVINDFVTLTRKGSADWQPILAAAGRLRGLSEDADAALCDRLQADIPQAEKAAQNAGSQNFGQVEVAIQKFRGIPVQVRVTDDTQQARVALPERFNQALQNAIVATGADYVAERIWAPYQPQFGEVEAIARQVAEELDSLIDAPELAHLEQQAITSKSKAVSSQRSQTELLTDLKQPDWKQRLKAIQKIELDGETFPAVVAALQDDRATVRRWAAALLGASEQAEALSPLRQMLLTDPSPIVRRTAGDALSDLGNPQAIAAMVAALGDASGLVRWRAVRFLNELGDASAIEPLTQAADAESEFDVRVEMIAAIDRIQAGKASQLPMWMRISNAN